MKELFKEIEEFQRTTFPNSTCLSKAKHLKKEIKELIDELELYKEEIGNYDDIRMEYADCFLLLIGSTQAYGMSYEEVIQAISEKLEINRNRKWGKPDENGVVLHIKES